MAEMGTDTVSEFTGTEQEVTTGAEETAATETATAEEAGETTGQEGEKTPEQIEEDKKQAEIEKAKKSTPEWFQKKIDKEVKRRHQAEERERKAIEEAAYHRGLAEGTRGKDRETTAIEPGETLEKPDPDKYETTAEYVAAMSDYSAKKAIAEHTATLTRKQQEAETKKAQEEWTQSVNAMVAKGQEEFEDFDEVTDGKNLRLTPVMVQAIMETGDMAHRIEYHLGTNKDLAQKIAGMKPLQQVKEIIKIEDTLKAASVKITTKAPPPVTTVGGTTQTTKDWTDPNISSDERIAQIRARKEAARKAQ